MAAQSRHDRSEGDINSTEARKTYRTGLSRETLEILEADDRCFLHQSLSTPCLDVLKGVEGIYLQTVDGRRLMDFHGNYCHNIGYGHPALIQNLQEQLAGFSFNPRRFTNAPATALASALAAEAPGDLNRVLFAPGGALAIGMALKLARLVTGKHKVISLWDSFHGASLDAISVGGERLFRDNLGPLLPGCEHAPPPVPDGCPFHCGSKCQLRCAEYVEYLMEQHGDVGAVLVEPVRCTDVQIPPVGYFDILRAACNRHDALLIFDEIPLALGRTGRFFCFEHFGVDPDIIVLGKALGGGVVPLAAVIAGECCNIGQSTALGHYTHEKNPFCATAGLSTLEIIREEGLVHRSAKLGSLLLEHLNSLRERHPAIREVRGLGLLAGIELVDPETGEPASEYAESVMLQCQKMGLSFKTGKGHVLVLAPPLTIREDQLLEAIEVLDRGLSSAAIR
jgi:4-aminobutyrate aminotransferase